MDLLAKFTRQLLRQRVPILAEQSLPLIRFSWRDAFDIAGHGYVGDRGKGGVSAMSRRNVISSVVIDEFGFAIDAVVQLKFPLKSVFENFLA